MKLHRFIGEFDLKQQRILITDLETVRQLKMCCDLHPATHCRCVMEKNKALARVVDVKDRCIEVDVIERMTSINTATLLTCILRFLKRENFEWVGQKATEVGVQEIIPLVTARTVKFSLRTRVEQIVKEAAEQSGEEQYRWCDPMKLKWLLNMHVPLRRCIFRYSKKASGRYLLETSLKQQSSVALLSDQKAVGMWMRLEWRR
jgi:RsmE family RNA methyltransferase